MELDLSRFVQVDASKSQLESELDEEFEYDANGDVILNQAKENNNAMYSLYSVCCHSGNLNSGHYTSYTRLIDPLTGAFLV